MISQKTINIKALIDHQFAVENAALAYSTLSSEKRPVGVLFKYDTEEKRIIRKIVLKAPAKTSDKIRVAVIGAGGYARAYHLPNLKRISNYSIRAIVSQTGSKARKVAEEYGAEYCATDYRKVLEDPDVDMVLIATRHNLHAPMVIDAAKAGKHIFVEKPIAMTVEECKKVQDAVAESRVCLAVGFNRRFSPLAQRAKRIAEKRRNPLMITYRVNSAGMKKEHWINDPIEGGGAIIGEGCHFFDFCNWMVGRDPVRIFAEMMSPVDQSVVGTNNIICTIKYQDGSVGSVIYNTVGSELYPKERMEMFVDGSVALIDDFMELGTGGTGYIKNKIKNQKKGRFELMDEYLKFLCSNKNNLDLPNVEDGIKATLCSLLVLRALKTGKVQDWGASLTE
jgi:predicted dehydrogenase